MQKLSELYRGKAKTVFTTDDPESLILEFRDDTSAGDGAQIEKFEHKGKINNKFNYFIMQELEAYGIPTQIKGMLSDTECLVKKLDMIPVECVMRNRSAGSLVRRLGIKEGEILNPPVYDLFLKNDALHDPMINESYCQTFGWATSEQLKRMYELTVRTNNVLTDIFDDAGFILVDFKLEFGMYHGEVILGDEFSPDGARLWDKKTKQKMDKDRFRQGLGEVIECYLKVANRIGIRID